MLTPKDYQTPRPPPYSASTGGVLQMRSMTACGLGSHFILQANGRKPVFSYNKMNRRHGKNKCRKCGKRTANYYLCNNCLHTAGMYRPTPEILYAVTIKEDRDGVPDKPYFGYGPDEVGDFDFSDIICDSFPGGVEG